MSQDLRKMPLNILRQMWGEAWGRKPHARIGRTMLERSLELKIRENQGYGFSPDQNEQLSKLIKQYNKRSSSFEYCATLKHGTRLVRMHSGKKHSVLVKHDGFEYSGKTYTSLSKIANDITGKKWNGWVFFGIKNAGQK